MKPFWCLLAFAILATLLIQQPVAPSHAPRPAAAAAFPPAATSASPRLDFPRNPIRVTLTDSRTRLPVGKTSQRLVPPTRHLYTGLPSPREFLVHDALASNRASNGLQRLDRLLDLSDTQTDALFEVLHRRTVANHPAILVRTRRSEFTNPTPLPGSGPGSPITRSRPEPPALDEEDEIAEILTPPQNQTLIAEEREADLWWTDILADLDRAP